MSAQAIRVQIGVRSSDQIERKVGDQVNVEAVFLDANGNPAPVDGLPVWTSTNPAILGVIFNGADAMVECISPGLAEVVCYADADMSSGVRNIAGRLPINVSAREAETVQIVVKE